MQVQLLCSFSATSGAAQNAVGNCKLPNLFFSKSRMALAKKRCFSTVHMRNATEGVRAVRIVSESAREESQKSSRAESSTNGMIAKDLEAQDESLQEQQLLSSTGAAAPYSSGSSFRGLSFTDHHLLLLGFFACVMTGALSCVMLAAIPTLIAMKSAAESLGKLADTAREELPGTMAAVRLSGMEISDLTMELSDLGQEISAGVRNSSRAVRAAEDGLRRIGNFTSVGCWQIPDCMQYEIEAFGETFANQIVLFTGIAVLQERVSGQVEVARPAVARAARSTREALMRARSLVHSLITLARLSSWLGRFWTFISPWKRKAISS